MTARAPTPPMGWNSFDCYGTSVTEAEVMANAEVMARDLLPYGWNTVVIDIQWSDPLARAGGYRPDADLVMDSYARLLPAANRFPSTEAGQGFRPLADRIHALGLKFGIHIMRGIPRRAVSRRLPVFGTSYTADEIADTCSLCPWNTDMYGLNMAHPGAQAYYDSILALYVQWGVDYIKADDFLYPYHTREIEGISRAVQTCGRDIMLSLSPGNELSLEHAEHLKAHCDLWRISADFWDRWEDVYAQFDRLRDWSPYAGEGRWPDADMLPLGRLGIRGEVGTDRQSLLTPDEQRTLMTLWAMARSPLMMGGDLPSLDPYTRSLLSNPALIALNQASHNNHEVWRDESVVVWLAEAFNTPAYYVAIFNRGDNPAAYELRLDSIGIQRHCHWLDLWEDRTVEMQDSYNLTLMPHSCRLLCAVWSERSGAEGRTAR